MSLSVALALALLSHDQRVTRSIAVEPDGDRLQILVSLRVPSGPQRRAAIVAAERRYDGRIDASERPILEAQLARRAVEGLALRVGNATVALSSAELKLRIPDQDDRPLELVLLGQAPLTSASLSLANKAGDFVELEVHAGSAPVRSTTKGKVTSGGFKAVLGVPDRVEWVVDAARVSVKE